MKLCRAGGVRLLNDNLLKNHFQYPLKSLKVSRFASYFHVEFGSPISYWVQLRPWAFLHLAVTDLQPDLGVCPSYGCWHIGRRLRACLGCWRGQKWKKNHIFRGIARCQFPPCMVLAAENLILWAESKLAGMMKQQVEQGFVPKPGDGSGPKMCQLNWSWKWRDVEVTS